jgi:hypothetical protein
MPVKTGIQIFFRSEAWIPACAGMTEKHNRANFTYVA